VSALTERQIRLLAEIVEGVGPHPASDDAARFRVWKKDALDDLDELEHLGFLVKADNKYTLSLLAIADLRSKDNVRARQVYDLCERTLRALRYLYEENPNREFSIAELATAADMPVPQIQRGLAYMLEAPVWSTAKGPRFATEAITPKEEILRFNDLASIMKFLRDQQEQRNGSPRGPQRMAAAPQTTFETAFETYEIVGPPLGEGAAGRVYPVKTADGELYALKCLSADRTTTERRKRFRNEIAFCSKHQHRNIIEVIDSGLAIVKNVRCPFYVMPRFAMTLRKRILPFFSQILDGVDAAHRLGAFHRDLKPENVLYDPKTDVLVVADFGIAHFEEDIIQTAVETKAVARMANLGYSAPEQRVKGAKVDHRADIFALGLILNEMFTGAVPHGTGYKTIEAIAPEFAYLDPLIESMIQNDPGARPVSIDAIKKELIARGNAFIALQELDATNKVVIPAFQASRMEAITIVGADWNHERLILQLNRVPQPGWVQRFQRPSAGQWHSFMGSGPETFQFNGNRAVVHADEQSAPQILDHAKQYVEMANQGYQQDLDRNAKQEELQHREKLRQEQAAAEQRARVVSRLRV
jgi:serine/threonine protein kinase/AraC-like DNA-binding protein